MRVRSTQKITSAMKMVAASRLRRAQEQAEAARPYAQRMERVLAEHPHLAGPTYSLADINVLSSAERIPRWAPDLMNEKISPRSWDWLQRMMSRPAVKATYSVSDEAPPRSTELRAQQSASAGA